MLEQARRLAADLGRRVELCEGDAQALPFPDYAFDTVLRTARKRDRAGCPPIPIVVSIGLRALARSSR
jgi:hypothetical protein